MTTTLPEVLALLDKATPGELSVYDENEGDGWPPRQLWCIKNADYDSGSEDAIPFQATIYYGGKEDAEAIAASVNLLRTHGDTLQRALALLAAVESGETVGTWQPIETAPEEGEFFVHMPDERVKIQVAEWHPKLKVIGHAFAFDLTKPTHWMPLPAAPAAPGVEG